MNATITNNGTDERSQAVVLVPKFGGKLAIVDLNTIKRLAAMLPKANLDEIRSDLIHKLRLCSTLDEHLQVIEEELAFHRSVNMITEYEEPTPH